VFLHKEGITVDVARNIIAVYSDHSREYVNKVCGLNDILNIRSGGSDNDYEPFKG